MTPAPTVDEIVAASIFAAELEAAWVDSLPADPARRHEEGGWVYYSATEPLFRVIRAGSGGRAFLDLDEPPELNGYFVVATYHTHPNPASEGWGTGPSHADTESAHILGVPCIIRAEDGIHTTGPPARRGGLTGNAGFPD